MQEDQEDQEDQEEDEEEEEEKTFYAVAELTQDLIGFNHAVYNLSSFIQEEEEGGEFKDEIAKMKPLAGTDATVALVEDDRKYIQFFATTMQDYLLKELQGGKDIPLDKGIECTAAMAGKGLTTLSKTADGSAHAYVKLTLTQQRLNSIKPLSAFKHLQFVNLSGNFLQEIKPLLNLEFVVHLDLSRNRLASFNIKNNNTKENEDVDDGGEPKGVFPYLQVLDLSGNEMTTFLPAQTMLTNRYLKRIILNNNKLTTVNGLQDLPALEILEVSRNKLTSIPSLPTAGTLRYCAFNGNAITAIQPLDNQPNLLVLLADDNKIASLDDGVSAKLVKLAKLSLRRNTLTNFATLKNLHVLPSMDSLNVEGNVMCQDDAVENYRLEVLIVLPSLGTLDKTPVSEDERAQSKELRNERIAEKAALEEAERIAEENEKAEAAQKAKDEQAADEQQQEEQEEQEEEDEEQEEEDEGEN